MAFELRVRNIGKLKDARIRIGRFTVFAGPNNTGKSYVSKFLYSIFNAMNANPIEAHVNQHTDTILEHLVDLKKLGVVEKFDLPVKLFLEELTVLRKLSREFVLEDMTCMSRRMSVISDRATKIFEMLPTVRTSLLSTITSNESGKQHFDSEQYLATVLQLVEDSMHILKIEPSEKNIRKSITYGLQLKIMDNLIQNFQISKLTILKNKEYILSEFDISDIGEFRIKNEKINFLVAASGLQQLQQYSKVIYLESPIYWKLKTALEDVRPPYVLGHRKQLSGVPGYFYDLARTIKYKYTGDITFPKLYERLIGKDVLGGKIDLSNIGNLSFLENGRSFPLSIAAMGVTNLGILALLIERKVLDKGTFLFIDEPEAHLHPAWQVIMADVLFELAKGGVNVVIATHSTEILKWLEVHIKRHPEDEKLVALNKFTSKGVDAHELDFIDKIAAIKEELTKPFAKLYTAGL